MKKKIIKCYLKNHPKNIPDDVLLIAGNIGSIIIGKYESIISIIEKMDSKDYYLELLREF